MSTALQLALPDDAAVVEAVLRGDVDAFGVLVDRYAPGYMRYAVQVLGTREDADEVLSTALYRAYQHLADCREPARFGAWLLRIVSNECRTRSSRRGRRERRFVRDERVLQRMPDRESRTDQSALREEIQRALARLPVEQREAFVLKYVEDRSYEEMSEIVGAGVSALKMRVKRACERLRELLGDSFDA
ncbi:MAG TPA: sigma-70 family RNA polymerase sigma factor [Gemmatimonadaceae bacterium]|nr:sigma-70 family RNA polymerase sigma factor [Gemmatimonadaceae bacterium]